MHIRQTVFKGQQRRGTISPLITNDGCFCKCGISNEREEPVIRGVLTTTTKTRLDAVRILFLPAGTSVISDQ